METLFELQILIFKQLQLHEAFINVDYDWTILIYVKFMKKLFMCKKGIWFFTYN